MGCRQRQCGDFFENDVGFLRHKQERDQPQARRRQGAGGSEPPRGPRWGFGWPRARGGEGQTRGGCGPAQAPSWALFLPGCERGGAARAQRLERKREAAAGREISPEE